MTVDDILNWDLHPVGKDCCIATFQIVPDPLLATQLGQIVIPDQVLSAECLILSGRGPLWLYAFLTAQLIVKSPERVLAIHEPRYSREESTTAVIVNSPVENQVGGFLIGGVSTGAVEYSQTLGDLIPEGCLIDWVELEREEYSLCQIALREMDPDAKAFMNPGQLASLSLPEMVGSDERGICFAGIAPTWAYARMAILALQKQNAWQSCFYLLGGKLIVTHSTRSSVHVGMEIDEEVAADGLSVRVGPAATTPSDRSPAGFVIAIIGPASSGKSVLSHGIQDSLRGSSGAWLTRANPDGSAMYEFESQSYPYAAVLRGIVKRPWGDEATSQKYATEYAARIQAMKPRSDWLFVDTGGQASPELKMILEVCTHAILLSRDNDEQESDRNDFRQLCKESNVTMLGDLRSNLTGETNLIFSGSSFEGTVAHLHREDKKSGESAQRVAKAVVSLLVAEK